MRLRFCALCFVVGGSMLFAPPSGESEVGAPLFFSVLEGGTLSAGAGSFGSVCAAVSEGEPAAAAALSEKAAASPYGEQPSVPSGLPEACAFSTAPDVPAGAFGTGAVSGMPVETPHGSGVSGAAAHAPQALFASAPDTSAGVQGSGIRLRRMLRISAVVFAAGLRCSEHLHPDGRRGAISRGRAARKGERHGERVALYADLQPPPKFCMKDCAMESPRPLPSVVRLASPRTKRWSTSFGAKFIS